MAAKTGTYTLINSSTLGSATSEVKFSNISSRFTDLILVFAGTLSATDVLVMRLNSDTGSNYSNTILEGNGTSASSTRQSNYGYSFLNSINLGTGQINSITHIMDYANTNTNKTFISRVNSAGAETAAAVGLWRSTATVDSVSIICNSNFASGSTFKLYGIEAGNL